MKWFLQGGIVMAASRGVKKVSENIVQDGRALIITEEDASKLKWENIPNGTIKVNPKNGLMMVKLEGETDWLPAGLKNDGTLCIIKDSMIIHEVFTVTSVPSMVNSKYTSNEFTYTNSDGEARHMPITDNNEFVFELEKGSYIRSRNHLSITVDDCLERTPASGGVREMTETRFALADALEVGHEITAKYIRIFRIGNPYPRVFMDNAEPEASEPGDLWIDMDGSLADNDALGENIEVNTTISWDRVTGTPTTVAGYGIKDKVSYEGHVHSKSEIMDFPASLPANGGNADTIDNHHAGTTANTVLVVQPDGKIPLSTLPDHTHDMSQLTSFNVGATAPSNPENNKTIWFCIKSGEMVIKFYSNNTWNTFGAVFL
jgi:hypothetical protein